MSASKRLLAVRRMTGLPRDWAGTAAAAVLLQAAALFGAVPGALAAPVGEVEFSRGVAAAQQPGQPARMLGSGATIERGEVMTTGANSVAVIKLNDGTKMTLRPNTSMAIDEFVLDQPGGSDSLVMNLFKGGMRVVTGLITKRNSSAGRLTTSTATVGIRGTDFDARICGEDCRSENRRPLTPLAQASAQSVLPASARVLQLQGALTAIGENGERRVVVAGGPAYKGDTLETPAGAQAVLVFRDDTRVTVQGGTRVRIDEFAYDARSPGEGSFALGLLKGGIRAFTGLIGKARPAAVRFSTATATVGIRGTGIDLTCEGACAGEPAAGPGSGFIIYTWQGEATVSSPAAPLEVLIVPVGTAAQVGGDNRPILLQNVPVNLINNPAPRPDNLQINLQQLFGGTTQTAPADGLYLYVRDGHLAVASGGQSLDIGRGETLFAGLGGIPPVRLSAPPAFIQGDTTPRPDRIDSSSVRKIDLVTLGLKARANLTCTR
jgi:hypothetical protein